MATPRTAARPGTTGDTRARRAVQRLGEVGQRRTIARQLVLDALDESGAHLSAAQVYSRIVAEHSAVTLSTVYRTLTTLVDCGLVHVLTYGNEARYGFADLPHHHAVCTGCGATTQIPDSALADVLPRLREVSGLVLAGGGVTLSGLCSRCVKSAGGR